MEDTQCGKNVETEIDKTHCRSSEGQKQAVHRSGNPQVFVHVRTCLYESKYRNAI
jgi:hypothetical protein